MSRCLAQGEGQGGGEGEWGTKVPISHCLAQGEGQGGGEGEWDTKVPIKRVGPSMTLAWPGWKQSDIAVEVDMGRLEESRFKKCCANCELLYFPSTEFKSAFNVY